MVFLLLLLGLVKCSFLTSCTRTENNDGVKGTRKWNAVSNGTVGTLRMIIMEPEMKTRKVVTWDLMHRECFEHVE